MAYDTQTTVSQACGPEGSFEPGAYEPDRPPIRGECVDLKRKVLVNVYPNIPQIYNLTAVPVAWYGATFSWTTDQPTSATLYYSTDPTFNTSTLNASLNVSTSQVFSSTTLSTGAQYYYYVVACNVFGACNTSNTQSVVIPRNPNSNGGGGGGGPGYVVTPLSSTTTTTSSTTTTTAPSNNLGNGGNSTSANLTNPYGGANLGGNVNGGNKTVNGTGTIGLHGGGQGNNGGITGFFLQNLGGNYPWYLGFGGLILLLLAGYSFKKWNDSRN